MKGLSQVLGLNSLLLYGRFKQKTFVNMGPGIPFIPSVPNISLLYLRHTSGMVFAKGLSQVLGINLVNFVNMGPELKDSVSCHAVLNRTHTKIMVTWSKTNQFMMYGDLKGHSKQQK